MRRSQLISVLFAGASLLPTIAFAQSQADPQPTEPGVVAEVVVTAQRRSERLVDVPASVSVVTSTELKNSGVSDSRDLRLLTPGLNITSQGTYVQPTIRGVGTTVTGTGADPNVAIYVDGVYISSQGSGLFDFNNVDQIEVLKGPQGSLYGRNATGGAIVVTTKVPSLTKTSASIDASYGSFDEVGLSVYGNLPLGDMFAVNVAAYSRKNDGYTRNLALGGKHSSITDSQGIRARLLFQPTDDFRAILTGAYIKQSDNAAYSYRPLNGNTPQQGSVAAHIPNDDYEHISLNNDPYNRLDYRAVTLNLDWDHSWGKLTSISSWAKTKYPFGTDLDGTEVPVQTFYADPQTQETETQELIYTSPVMGRVSWLGGLYYYHDESITQARVAVGGAFLPFPSLRPYVHVDATAYAAYAEVKFDLTDSLHLTVGGRYSSEKKHATNNDGGPNGAIMLDASHTWSAFTPRVALRYDVTEKSSAYASYSEGFKSGLFDGGATGACTTAAPRPNPACPSAGVPVQPEKVKAYEIGYKYNVGATVFSTSVFYSQYENIQINALNTLNQQVLYNAAAGEIYGLDADFSARLNDNFSIHVGGAYTHGRYTSFLQGQNWVPIFTPGGLPNGNTQVVKDDSGNKLIRTPEFAGFASLTFQHDVPVGHIESTVTASYSGSYFWHVDNRLKQPAFTIVNANLTWYSPSDAWKVSVFGANLTDEHTELYVREAAVGDFASFAKPRTFGVALGYKF
ncbi:MAG: putative TonB-dependent receptor [Caulobacter sp.]|nr:putative TonB-dependent receptor [Caulobacter sp.]